MDDLINIIIKMPYQSHIYQFIKQFLNIFPRNIQISKKILSVVVKHPEYSAKKIGEVLASRKRGGIDIDPTLIYRELKKLKLSTIEKRLAYIKRKAAQEKST